MTSATAWVKKHAIDVRPLKHPAYRRLFVGNAVSFFGFQFTAVAVPVQIYALTRSALWVGLASGVGLVPLVVFSLWGGAIADAFDRRRVLLVSSALMWITTLALLLQALLHVNRPELILALVAAQAAAFGVTSPARQSILPALLEPGEIPAASTLSFTVSNLATVLGPLGAGVAIALTDVTTAYAVDAVAFTVALWAALRLPSLPPGRTKVSTGRLGDMWEGLRFLAGSKLILLTFAVDIAAMVLALPRALFPAVADQRFGEASLGWLYSSIGLGAFLAGVTSGWIGRVSRQGLALVLAVVGWGLAVAAAGSVPWLWACVAMMAVAGAADMISGVYRQTMLLTYAPDEMRGRLQGVFFAVVAGGPRLGDLRAGSMAEVTGTTFAWVGGGLAASAVAIVLGVTFPVLRHYTAPATHPRPELRAELD